MFLLSLCSQVVFLVVFCVLVVGIPFVLFLCCYLCCGVRACCSPLCLCFSLFCFILFSVVCCVLSLFSCCLFRSCFICAALVSSCFGCLSRVLFCLWFPCCFYVFLLSCLSPLFLVFSVFVLLYPVLCSVGYVCFLLALCCCCVAICFVFICYAAGGSLFRCCVSCLSVCCVLVPLYCLSFLVFLFVMFVCLCSVCFAVWFSPCFPFVLCPLSRPCVLVIPPCSPAVPRVRVFLFVLYHRFLLFVLCCFPVCAAVPFCVGWVRSLLLSLFLGFPVVVCGVLLCFSLLLSCLFRFFLLLSLFVSCFVVVCCSCCVACVRSVCFSLFYCFALSCFSFVVFSFYRGFLCCFPLLFLC